MTPTTAIGYGPPKRPIPRPLRRDQSLVVVELPSVFDILKKRKRHLRTLRDRSHG